MKQKYKAFPYLQSSFKTKSPIQKLRFSLIHVSTHTVSLHSQLLWGTENKTAFSITLELRFSQLLVWGSNKLWKDNSWKRYPAKELTLHTNRPTKPENENQKGNRQNLGVSSRVSLALLNKSHRDVHTRWPGAPSTATSAKNWIQKRLCSCTDLLHLFFKCFPSEKKHQNVYMRI